MKALAGVPPASPAKEPTNMTASAEIPKTPVFDNAIKNHTKGRKLGGEFCCQSWEKELFFTMRMLKFCQRKLALDKKSVGKQLASPSLSFEMLVRVDWFE